MTAGSAEAAGWTAALLVLLRVVELAIGENILGGIARSVQPVPATVGRREGQVAVFESWLPSPLFSSVYVLHCADRCALGQRLHGPLQSPAVFLAVVRPLVLLARRSTAVARTW